jgi:hypothetical protein
MGDMLDWNVAIYCANEREHLRDCLTAAEKALAGKNGLITIILNGSNDDSLDIAREFVRKGAPAEVFQIQTGDKANAINQFVYRLRSPALAYGEIDGYATIGEKSFVAMEERFRVDQNAIALTGISVTGRTMVGESEKAVNEGGRLFGQFHAFRPDFFDRMVARQIKLPVGLYRGDGLLGSMAAHNLDSVYEPWVSSRIAAVTSATFSIPVLSPFKLGDLNRQFRRKIRQMRGRIENNAIKSIIYKAGYEGLEDHADAMIGNYLARHPIPRGSLVDSIFLRLAVREHAASRRPGPASLLPTRIM